MLDVIRKLAALLLLLTIPLQGIASAGPALECPPAEIGAAPSFSGDNAAGQGRDGGAQAVSEHVFCHQFASGMPVISTAAPTGDSTGFQPVTLLPSLFIPDQPHRPPFA